MKVLIIIAVALATVIGLTYVSNAGTITTKKIDLKLVLEAQHKKSSF